MKKNNKKGGVNRLEIVLPPSFQTLK